MKSMATMVACVAALAACGCAPKPWNTAPRPGLPDPYPAGINNPQISVLDPALQQVLYFQPPVVVRGETPLHVEVPVRNNADRGYLIDYRFVYFDEKGRRVEPVMGWRMVSLEPKQIERLVGRALDRSAEDWQLEVKWSR